MISPNDEIDLVEVFATLWRKKRFIVLVSLIFCCVAVLFLLVSPRKYVGEFALRGPIGAQLVAYVPVNDLIKDHYDAFKDDAGETGVRSNQFEISTNRLVQKMVRELQDYDELAIALKQHSAVVNEMSEEEFFEEKAALNSKFFIALANDQNPDVKITLEWHNKEELIDIIVTTISLAEENMNNEILTSLNGLAENIERRNHNKLKKLDNALLSLAEIINLETKSRKLFLEEQAVIARELGLSENGLANGGQDNQLSLTFPPSGNKKPVEAIPQLSLPAPIYLRGYKSLEKEAALLLARSEERNHLLNPNFMATKRKVIELEHDDTANQFRAAISASPFAAGANIFDVSKDFVWVAETRSSALIVAVSILIGLFVGSIFVLLQTVQWNRRGS